MKYLIIQSLDICKFLGNQNLTENNIKYLFITSQCNYNTKNFVIKPFPKYTIIDIFNSNLFEEWKDGKLIKTPVHISNNQFEILNKALSIITPVIQYKYFFFLMCKNRHIRQLSLFP